MDDVYTVMNVDMPNTPHAHDPVFIFGVPRSGTTLLFRTLLRHPEFLPEQSAPELFFVESKVFQFANDRNRFLKLFMGGDEQEYSEFLKKTFLTRSINRVYRSYPLRRWVEECPPRVRAKLWKTLGQDKLVRSYFEHVKAAKKCNRVLEKTPIHYKFFPEITESFPGASFIWIYRHPVDVFASYRRRGTDERDQKLTPTEGDRWLSVTVKDFADRYKEGIKAMNTLSALNPDLHYALSYEDLVANPEPTIKRLCGFLNIDYDRNCIEGGEKNILDLRDPLLSEPIQSKTKDWSDYLSEDEVNQLQHLLLDDLESLGYPHYDFPV